MNNTTKWIIWGILGVAGLATGVSSLLLNNSPQKLAFVAQSVDTPILIDWGLQNEYWSEQDKLYGYYDNWSVDILYLTRNGQSKVYSYNLLTKKISKYKVWIPNNPSEVNAIGANHRSLWDYCIWKNAIFGKEDRSTIKCSNDNVFYLNDYPIISDIEIKDNWVISAIVVNNNGEKFLCQNIENLLNCAKTSNYYLFIDDNNNAISTDDYQFYSHFWHDITHDYYNGKALKSSLYPELKNSAISVWLTNENTNNTRFILWTESNSNLYLYPSVFCGNGIVEQPESCDDGNQNDYDWCSNSCEAPMVIPTYDCVMTSWSTTKSCVTKYDGSGPFTEPTCGNSCEDSWPYCGDNICQANERDKFGNPICKADCQWPIKPDKPTKTMEGDKVISTNKLLKAK